MILTLFSKGLWLPSATREAVRYHGGVRDWLADGDWSPEAGVTKKRLTATIHLLDTIGDACVNDGLRLANAAFESASAVSPRRAESRSWAWQLISYYYAGYFAANALMRFSGHGCLNLSALDCASINQQTSLYGVGGKSDADKIVPGLYYTYIGQGKTTTWNISAISAKGGVHIQFWVGFLKYLSDLEKSIKSSGHPKMDKEKGLAELANLVSGLKYSGAQNGAWLSEVRNAANYRLEYGLWYPYDGCPLDGVAAASAFKSAVNGSASAPLNAQQFEDVERAVRLSGVLLSWLRECLIIVHSNSVGSKKSLLTNGAFAFAASL